MTSPGCAKRPQCCTHLLTFPDVIVSENQMCALDRNKVPWIGEFGFVPGCCPEEYHALPVALSLPIDRDNSVCGSIFIVPYGVWQVWQHRKLLKVTYAYGELVAPMEYRDTILCAFSVLPSLQLLWLGSHFFLVCRNESKKVQVSRISTE